MGVLIVRSKISLLHCEMSIAGLSISGAAKFIKKLSVVSKQVGNALF